MLQFDVLKEKADERNQKIQEIRAEIKRISSGSELPGLEAELKRCESEHNIQGALEASRRIKTIKEDIRTLKEIESRLTVSPAFSMDEIVQAWNADLPHTGKVYYEVKERERLAIEALNTAREIRKLAECDLIMLGDEWTQLANSAGVKDYHTLARHLNY